MRPNLGRSILLGAWFAAVVSCSGEEGEEGSGAAPGDLPCDTTPVECRAAFRDVYEGTYAGAVSGRLILDIDMNGGIVGTVTAANNQSAALFGRVNEFGRVEFTSDDDTIWVGQFTADHRFAGTWAAADGKEGTFQGRRTAADPEPADPADDPADPADDPFFAAARAACRAVEHCEGVTANCDQVTDEDLAAVPIGCRDATLSLYACQEAAACEFQTACLTEFDEALDCLTFGPSEPPDPGTSFDRTGNRIFDQATVTCSACLPEASACHEADACFDYAECVISCESVACLQRCLILYDEGHDLWLAAVDCSSLKCDAG